MTTPDDTGQDANEAEEVVSTPATPGAQALPSTESDDDGS